MEDLTEYDDLLDSLATPKKTPYIQKTFDNVCKDKNLVYIDLGGFIDPMFDDDESNIFY